MTQQEHLEIEKAAAEFEMLSSIRSLSHAFKSGAYFAIRDLQTKVASSDNDFIKDLEETLYEDVVRDWEKSAEFDNLKSNWPPEPKGTTYAGISAKPTTPDDTIDGKFSKKKIIARLKKIGFIRMDEPNHYANECGLSFVFVNDGMYTLADGYGNIRICTDDVFDVFDEISRLTRREFNRPDVETINIKS